MNRQMIEKSMDAWDDFIKKGDSSKHANKFSGFGTPLSYWVRSTKSRKNNPYPSKPIHFDANGQKDSSGGWGGPSYSAVALHNAGYIIVDENDWPIDWTEKKHRIKDEIRIRLCAFNYFIAPAQENGMKNVLICAEELATAIGFCDAQSVYRVLTNTKWCDYTNISVTCTEQSPKNSTIVQTENSLADDTQNRPNTMEDRLMAARIGQGAYRTDVIKLEKICRLTGISDPQHLRASHIKPWSVSNDDERLDGNNGLLLSPHIDHLFDRGFISVEDDGSLRISEKLDPNILNRWGINPSANLRPLREKQLEYIKYHREHIFQKPARKSPHNNTGG